MSPPTFYLSPGLLNLERKMKTHTVVRPVPNDCSYFNVQNPKVQSTASLMKDWERKRRDILDRAEKKFVLFPSVPSEDMEDVSFAAPKGIKRPRYRLPSCI